MNSGAGRIAKTIVISGLSVVISYLINFFLTPFITDNIGMGAYGFVSIANNVVTYAGIITVALTSFVVRYVSVSYHKNNIDEANQYYSSAIFATFFLTGLLLIIAVVVILKLQYLLNIPEDLVVSVKLLFLVTFVNFAVTTFTTTVSVGAYIKNRLDITGLIKIASHCCNAIVLVGFFLCFKPQIWFVGVGTLISSLITLLSNYVLQKILVPDLTFKKKSVSLQKVKDMMGNGVWNSLNQLGNVLNSGLDLIISNLMLTDVATGQISVAKTIGAIFQTLYQVVFQPFQPRLIKKYALGNKEDFIHEVELTMKVCGCFSNIAFAGFASLGMLYYTLWLPQQDTPLLYGLTVVTVLGSITAGAMQPVYYIYTLTVKNKIPCWVTIAGGFLNVVAMYFLLKYTNVGPYAIVVTTAVIMISINVFFNPTYAARCLNVSSFILYPTIFRHLISCGVMTIVFRFMSKIAHPSTWYGLIITAILMVMVGVAIHFVVVTSAPEKRIVKQTLQKTRV